MPWWTLTDHHGTTIPTALAQLYTCDATIAPLLVDPDGNPLHAGRTRRTPTRTQRRALEHRDGGCTFPGCTAALTWLDAHHITHWERGGPTDPANLVLLCRRHHRVAHRTGWTLELDPHGWTHWTTPTGTTFRGQRHHRQPHQEEEEEEEEGWDRCAAGTRTVMSTDPKHTDTAGDHVEDDGRHLAPEPLDPEPLDPEPLAVDADDLNDFIDRHERTDPNPGERDIDTDVQPPL